MTFKQRLNRWSARILFAHRSTMASGSMHSDLARRSTHTYAKLILTITISHKADLWSMTRIASKQSLFNRLK